MYPRLKNFINFALSCILFVQCQSKLPDVKEGDILFQSSTSKQAKAIELATHSGFSHVGVVLKKDGKLMVFEAVGPVKFTPIDKWIRHGKGGRYVVMRLKNQPNDSVFIKMEAAVPTFEGKNYDSYFDWSDNEMYCSELVWKIYKTAGIELCPLKKFKDYDFSNPFVRAKLNERFGNDIPLNEDIVSPEDLSKSALLREAGEK